MPQRVLVLFAHPSLDRSEANAELLRSSRHRDGVDVVDLYAEYPTFRIDIDHEQQRLRDHDVVVFMFPLFRYSTPAILKEWQDLALEYGFAYGADGNALHGKMLLCAITAGGTREAYSAEGYNHYPTASSDTSSRPTSFRSSGSCSGSSSITVSRWGPASAASGRS